VSGILNVLLAGGNSSGLVNPLDYDSGLYSATSFSPGSATAEFFYDSNGTWSVVLAGTATSNTKPLSGTWTTIPSNSYEYSTDAGVTWFAFPVGNNLLASVSASGGPNFLTLSISLLVRVIGQVTTVVTSTLTLEVTII
jgi:hypothetical protein